MTWAEVYTELVQFLAPFLQASSRNEAVIRTKTGGRLDFWTIWRTRSPAAAAAIGAS